MATSSVPNADGSKPAGDDLASWENGDLKLVLHPSDDRLGRILGKMTTLKQGFSPSWWLKNPFLQMGVEESWKTWNGLRASFEKTVLECPDGGQVALEEFLPPSGTVPLPDEAPIVVILHTITGTSFHNAELAKNALKRGMRTIVLSRRGHFGKMTVPKFNLFGCVTDTEFMVKHVKQKYPKAFIGAIGLSAGSGQVVSAIGKQRGPSPIQAAASLSPGYDVRNAFKAMDEDSPLVSKFLLHALKTFFLRNNHEVLSSSKGYQEAHASKSVQEFLEASVHMAGHNSFEEYLEKENPMANYSTNQVPCLLLNSVDDPLCLESNIQYDLISTIKNYALVVTKHGSHVSFRHGWFGSSSFMHDLALDFLEQARAVLEEQKEGPTCVEKS